MPGETRQWNERGNAPATAGRQNESMFQLLFERSADAIWLFDPRDAVFVDCNDAAVALMRSGAKDKLLRTHPAELSPPAQPDGRSSRVAAGAITALVEKNGAHRFEWTARRLDGTDVPLEIIATAIQAQGRSLHVVVSRDITERVRAEAALRESQELLSSVANNIAQAVYRTGPAPELTFVNRTYLQMFGFGSLRKSSPGRANGFTLGRRSPAICGTTQEGRPLHDGTGVRPQGQNALLGIALQRCDARSAIRRHQLSRRHHHRRDRAQAARG